MNAHTDTTPRPVGRPPTGTKIQVRLPADLLDWVDRNAAECEITRAQFIREALDYARALEFPAALEQDGTR